MRAVSYWPHLPLIGSELAVAMTKTPLLALAAASAALVLTACGGDDESSTDLPGVEVSASDSGDALETTSGSAQPSSASPSASGGSADNDDLHDVEVSDQSGDGSSVLVDRVRVEAAGFVVIVVDDEETVVGSTAVEAGEASQVSVPTEITESGEYDARLYVDDGDGQFDPAADQPVADDDGTDDDNDDDDDEDDLDDIESEDFDYEVG